MNAARRDAVRVALYVAAGALIWLGISALGAVALIAIYRSHAP